jgi:flagellar motor protein MotB
MIIKKGDANRLKQKIQQQKLQEKQERQQQQEQDPLETEPEMNDDDVIIIPQEADDMGTVILMLGLYLIVLAFFILLNTMAIESPTRSAKAAASIADGFGFRNTGTVRLDDSTDITMNTVFETVAEEIKDIMETYISVRDFRFKQNNEEMVLRVDTEAIFSPGQISIRPEMAPLFYDLAHTISNPKPGTTLTGSVMMHTASGESSGSALSVAELSIRRATLFTRAIIERGVEGRLLSAGTVRGDKPEVVITFKVLVDNPHKAREEGARILEERGGVQ